MAEVQEVHWEEVTDCAVFDMFVEYLYQSSYNVPAPLGAAAKCVLLARLFRLAEYTSMDDLSRSALQKLTDLLKKNTSPSLQPHEVLDLLEIAYGDAFGATTSSVRNSNVEQHDTALEVDGSAGCVKCDHEKTTSAPSNSMAAEFPSEQKDPLRQVTAKYSAVLIGELQKDVEFRKIFFRGGEMASDIMSFVRPAYSL